MNREILRIAIPAIISNITTPLLGLVDTAITGHMGAAVYLAAIAVGSTMFSMLYWLMAFLRMGTSGMTAQAYGAGAVGTARDILRRGMVISAAVSVAMIVLSPWLADVLLLIMDADASTTEMARTYFLIVIWGAPAVLGTYTLSGWFLGMQDSKAPMWMALTTNVVNIIVSLLLVLVFGMKIVGVATGTLVAQWAGVLLGVALYLRCRRRMHRGGAGEGITYKRFFSVNGDIFLRTLCLVAVTVWFTRSGAAMGTDVLAANSLLMQLFILFSYFMDGFAFAGEALSGKHYGAHDAAGLKRAVRGVLIWGAGVAVLFTAVYLCFGSSILRVLTDEPQVVATAHTYLPWAVAVPMAGVMAFAWDGIFIGLTMTRQMLWTMIAAMAVYFAAFYAFTPKLANHGLWLAFILYLGTRGLVQTILYKKSCHPNQ